MPRKLIDIYTLVDPLDNKVRYVGSSVNTDGRLNGHSNFPTNWKVQRWIQNLRAKGVAPTVEVVEQTYARKSRERYWIKRFARDNHLLNTVHNVQRAKQPGKKWKPLPRVKRLTVFLTEQEYEKVVADAGEMEISRYLRLRVLTVPDSHPPKDP